MVEVIKSSCFSVLGEYIIFMHTHCDHAHVCFTTGSTQPTISLVSTPLSVTITQPSSTTAQKQSKPTTPGMEFYFNVDLSTYVHVQAIHVESVILLQVAHSLQPLLLYQQLQNLSHYLSLHKNTL